ncbi:MAG TPA: hypothetical protein VI282_12180 [Verrucomicrobiae bacterium]
MAPASKVPLLPARLDWPSAIGLFIMNFGTLDYRIFEFLEERLSPGEFKTLQKKSSFEERLSRITKCLDSSQFTDKQRAAFNQFAERVRKIRDVRNHIAHGYMLCGFDDQAQITIELCKTKDIYDEHSPGSLRLTFEMLQDANNLLCKSSEEFTEATAQPPPRKIIFDHKSTAEP